MMTLTQRISAAWNIVRRGYFPFNRIPDDSSSSSAALDQPYKQSVWVMRAILKVAQPIQAVPLRFGDARGGVAIDNDELDQWWSSPCSNSPGIEWIEASVGWLKLEGECFFIMDDTWIRPGARLATRSKLIIARPDRMQPVTNGEAVIGWEYTDASSNRHSLLPEQVVQIRSWNPYDSIRGMAEMDAARVAAEADYSAAMFSKNLMANNGDRGVYVIAKNGLPTDEQRHQIIAQLREKRAAAQRGDFRAVFLTGDIAVEDPKVQSVDADFAAQRLENRHEIFIAFGVPPSMADVAVSYSIGSASDRFILIEDTCKPTGEKICAGLEPILRRQTGLDMGAWFDWDEHSIMQQVRAERIEAAQKLWNMGMPMEQINDYMRLGMAPYAGWDVGYLPFSVGAVEELTAPVDDDDFAEPTEPQPSDQIAAMVRTLRSKRRQALIAPPPPPTPCGCAADPGDVFQRARDPRQVQNWQRHMSLRKATIKQFESKFRRQLMIARRETLANLAMRLTAGAPTLTQRSAGAEIAFDLNKWKPILIAAMRPVIEGALEIAGKQLLEELGMHNPWTMPPKEVIDFLRQRENRISEAAQNVWESVRDTIDDGLQSGDSIKQIADAIRGRFNDIGERRATTIAMTETTTAYGAGRQSAMRSAGITHKQWLTSGNPNVRPSHAMANEQIVPIDEPFRVGGDDLMFPGDPSGSPEEVINCHCVSLPVMNPDNPDE